MPAVKPLPERLPLPARIPTEPVRFLGAYASESVPGAMWYTFAALDGSYFGCTCRGYLKVKPGQTEPALVCEHLRAEAEFGASVEAVLGD